MKSELLEGVIFGLLLVTLLLFLGALFDNSRMKCIDGYIWERQTIDFWKVTMIQCKLEEDL